MRRADVRNLAVAGRAMKEPCMHEDENKTRKMPNVKSRHLEGTRERAESESETLVRKRRNERNFFAFVGDKIRAIQQSTVLLPYPLFDPRYSRMH